jgi:hypothetical protein
MPALAPNDQQAVQYFFLSFPTQIRVPSHQIREMQYHNIGTTILQRQVNDGSKHGKEHHRRLSVPHPQQVVQVLTIIKYIYLLIRNKWYVCIGDHKIYIFIVNIPTFHARYRRYVPITNELHEFY